MRDHLERQELIAAELIAVRAAVDFTYVMEALHTLGSTCTDRKVTDFFYDAAERQTFVIDWNVLRSNEAIYKIGEIRQFASLWHELFLERKGVPPFDPYNDLRWLLYPNMKTPSILYSDMLKPLQAEGAVSLGLRVLLAQAIDFEPANAKHRQFAQGGGDYFAVLRDQLTLWEAALSRGGGSQSEFVSQFGVSLSEAAAIAADLDWRVDPSERNAALRDVALKATRREQRTELGASRDQIENALKIDVETAQREARRIEEEYAANEDWENWSHMRRWELLLDVERAVNLESANATIALRRMLTDLGLALHRSPDEDTAQDLDAEAKRLSEVQRQIADNESRGVLHQIETELRIRRTVRAAHPGNSTLSLSERQQAIKALDIPLKFDDQGANHYLDGPDGLTLQQRIGRTLLRKLLRDYDLAAWLARVEELATSNPIQIYETLQLLEAAETSSIERGLLRHATHSLAELARFADRYPTSAPREEMLPLLIKQAGELKKQAREEGLREVFDRVINPIVLRTVEQAREALVHTLQTRIQPADLERLSPVVDALKLARRDSIGESDERLKVIMDYFGRVVDLREQWRLNLSKFLSSPPQNREGLAVLSGLLTKMEQLRGKDGRGIDMSDLIGSLDEQRQYLTKLDEVMKTSVSEAEEKITNLRDNLEAHADQIEDVNKRFQKVFQDYRQQVRDSSQQLQAELSRQQQATSELDIQRALENFDLPALRELQKTVPSSSPSSPKLTDALSQLQSLDASPELKRMMPYGVLSELHKTRDQLRREALEEIDGSRQKLFTDPEIAKLAVSQPLLAGVIDLYWGLQIKRSHEQAGGAPIRAEFEQRSDLQVKATKENFENIRICFNKGDYDVAVGFLQKINTEYSKTSLADAFVHELSAGWRYRIETARRANQMIEWLRTQLDQPPITLERASDLMDGLVMVMQNCPADCFNDHLYALWKAVFDLLRARMNDLLDKEEKSLRGRNRSALHDWRTGNDHALETVAREALGKITAFEQIYPLGGTK